MRIRSFSVLIGLLLAFVIPSRARAQDHPVEGADYRVFTKPGDPAKYAEIAANVNINTVELAERFGVSVFDIRKDNPTNTLALCHTARDRYVMSMHIRTADDRATNEVWNTCAEDRKAVYIIPGVTIKVTGTHYLTPAEEHGFVEGLKGCADANCVQAQLDKLGSKAKVSAPQEPAAQPKTPPPPAATVAAAPAPSPSVTAKPVATAKVAPTVAPSEAPSHGPSPIVGILGLCAFGLVMAGAGNIAGRRSAKKKLLKQLELAKQLPPGPTLRNLTAPRVVQEDNFRAKYVEAAQRLEHADAENVRLGRVIAHYESLKTSQVAISGSSVILQMAPTVPQPVLPGPEGSVEAQIEAIDSRLASDISTMSAHDRAQAMGKLSFLTTQLQATKGRDEAIPALPVSTLRASQDSESRDDRQTMPDGAERKGTLKGLGITPVAAVAQQSIITELEDKGAKLESQVRVLQTDLALAISAQAKLEASRDQVVAERKSDSAEYDQWRSRAKSVFKRLLVSRSAVRMDAKALRAWKEKATESIVTHAKARRALRRKLTAAKGDLAVTKSVVVETTWLKNAWRDFLLTADCARQQAKQASVHPEGLDDEMSMVCVKSLRSQAFDNAVTARRLRDQVIVKLAAVLDTDPASLQEHLCSDFAITAEEVVPANPTPAPAAAAPDAHAPETWRGVGQASDRPLRSLKEFPVPVRSPDSHQSDPFGNLVDSLRPMMDGATDQLPPGSLKAPLIPAEARRPTLPSFGDDEETKVQPRPELANLPKRKSPWSVTPPMGNPVAVQPNGYNGTNGASKLNGANGALHDVVSDKEIDNALQTLSVCGATGHSFLLNKQRDEWLTRFLNVPAACDREVLGPFAQDDMVAAEFCDSRSRTLEVLLQGLYMFAIPGRKRTMPPPVFQNGNG